MLAAGSPIPFLPQPSTTGYHNRVPVQRSHRDTVALKALTASLRSALSARYHPNCGRTRQPERHSTMPTGPVRVYT
jgi:hypothetical protein